MGLLEMLMEPKSDCGRASAVPFISLRINLDLQGYVGKRFAGPR
jgi:hypothetical protein